MNKRGDFKMAMNAAKAGQTYEAGLSMACARLDTAHDKPMDARLTILRQQATEIFRYVQAGGVDFHDAIDRLDNAREALGIDPERASDLHARAQCGGKATRATDGAAAGTRFAATLRDSCSRACPTSRCVRSTGCGRSALALGKVTALAGYGGLGKSTVLFDMAAAVNRGAAWPAGEGFAPLGSTPHPVIAKTIRKTPSRQD